MSQVYITKTMVVNLVSYYNMVIPTLLNGVYRHTEHQQMLVN